MTELDNSGWPLVVVVDQTNQAHIAYWGSRGQCNLADTLVARAEAMHATWSPEWIFCCFDTGPSFRRDLVADYKAGRPDPPPGLPQALVDAAHDLEQSGFPVLGAAGFEADDVIATVCRLALAKRRRVVIVSQDKDVRQCLVPLRVSICDKLQLARGRLIPSFQTAATVQEKFGVRADQWIDYQALCGNTTDGIRGADGIGAVTAAKLLQAAGTLETLLADPWKFAATARVRNALFEFRGRVELTKRLVTLRTDAPVAWPQLAMECAR